MNPQRQSVYAIVRENYMSKSNLITMPDLKNTIEILEKLIAFPTISSESNIDLITYVAKFLKSNGAKVSVFPNDLKTKQNLFATIGPDIDGGIIFSGHTDVVPANSAEWGTEPFKLHHKNNRLYGRGACDMKGFIATVLASVPSFSKLNLRKPIHIALTYDEEVGCQGAKKLVEHLKQNGPKPEIAIIGEPTNLKIIDGHKGCYEYTTTFEGTEGHGSDINLEINAIHYATKFINKLMNLAKLLETKSIEKQSRYSPPWTSLQVGKINGGLARNIIAKRCSVEWEMRPVCQEDAQFVKKEIDDFIKNSLLPEMQKISDKAKIETETIGEVSSLEITKNNKACELLSKLLDTKTSQVVSFGTEAGLFQSLGISVVVCGPGSIKQAHKPNEYIEINELSKYQDLLVKLEQYI